MDALLGFVVLSGPLFLIVLFLLVAIGGVFILRKKVTGAKKRLLGSALIFAVAYFILFGDELIASRYLEYLCENKTEKIIHAQIKLPKKYWDDDGSLKYPIFKNGLANYSQYRSFYEINSIKEPYIDFFIKIIKYKDIYIDAITKQKVATKITFSRKYGWLSHFSPGPAGGESCRNILIRKNGKSNYSEMNIEATKIFLNQLFEQK